MSFSSEMILGNSPGIKRVNKFREDQINTAVVIHKRKLLKQKSLKAGVKHDEFVEVRARLLRKWGLKCRN